MSNDIETRLDALFEADRVLREAEQAFHLAGEAQERVDALGRSLEATLRLEDPEESALRLMRLAELLGEETGATVVRHLLRLLDHDEPGVRAAAGESLLELGYSRYAEVARGVEKVIEEGKALNALKEVPYLLSELGEPGGVKLCIRLLKHADANVVGAAIEALAMLSDPTALKDIDRLKTDKRVVDNSDSDEEDAGPVTVGELAREAIDHLRALRG